MLTRADFDALDWQKLIVDADTPICFHYAGLFYEQALKVEDTGNDVGQQCYLSLALLTSLWMRLDNWQQPFEPVERLKGFGDDLLITLSEIYPQIAEPEMQARVCDVLWIQKRDFLAAKTSVSAYLKAAKILESNKNLLYVQERVERAYQVAAQLGLSNQNLLNDVLVYVEKLIECYEGGTDSNLIIRLQTLLQHYGKVNIPKYALLSQRQAEEAETREEWHVAHLQWWVGARWHALAHDTDGERRCQICAAETFVRRAEQRVAEEPKDWMGAAAEIKHAIYAYRKIGSVKEKVYELNLRLLKYERNIPEQLTDLEHKGTFDARELIDNAISSVCDLSIPDALRALGLIARSPSKTRLEEVAREQAQLNPLLSFISKSTISSSGKTIGVSPSMVGEEQLRVNAVLEASMFTLARYERFFVCVGAIKPALDRVIQEHAIREHHLYPLCLDNPFVPPGRVLIFAKGILAGMYGNHILSNHLLIPQIENSVRRLLEMKQVIVAGLDNEGVEEERTLGTILSLPETVQLLGEDLVFDLRSLLTEKAGENLRNVLAHGLADEDIFTNNSAMYIWWLVLHMCCLFSFKHAQNDQKT